MVPIGDLNKSGNSIEADSASTPLLDPKNAGEQSGRNPIRQVKSGQIANSFSTINTGSGEQLLSEEFSKKQGSLVSKSYAKIPEIDRAF